MLIEHLNSLETNYKLTYFRIVSRQWYYDLRMGIIQKYITHDLQN